MLVRAFSLTTHAVLQQARRPLHGSQRLRSRLGLPEPETKYDLFTPPGVVPILSPANMIPLVYLAADKAQLQTLPR